MVHPHEMYDIPPTSTRFSKPERTTAAEDPSRTIAVHAPTVADVHLGHLSHNLAAIRRATHPATVMAVVKANAYGHGASPIANALAEEGVRWFAVATVAEAIHLRQTGLDGRILVLGAPLPAWLEAYPRHDLEVTVSSEEMANLVIERAGRGDAFRVHVKVDTGMGRIGIPPERVERVVRALDRVRRVNLAGLWTHLATADSPDPRVALEQIDRFRRVVAKVGDAAETLHVAATTAAIGLPEAIRFDRAMIRTGIGLYGYANRRTLTDQHGLRPVMRLSSRITHVKRVGPGTSVSYGQRWTADRTTCIATVNAGYADGYPRIPTNRAKVNVRGTCRPVVGTVCMDMFMVNVGPQSDVAPGDEVTLFGEDRPDALDVALWAETIPHEILASLPARVPRRYLR